MKAVWMSRVAGGVVGMRGTKLRLSVHLPLRQPPDGRPLRFRSPAPSLGSWLFSCCFCYWARFRLRIVVISELRVRRPKFFAPQPGPGSPRRGTGSRKANASFCIKSTPQNEPQHRPKPWLKPHRELICSPTGAATLAAWAGSPLPPEKSGFRCAQYRQSAECGRAIHRAGVGCRGTPGGQIRHKRRW